MDISAFIKNLGCDFFVGVPDSQLKPLCNYLMNTYGISKEHIIAANEGNCASIAAGYHLATGKIPVVYLQNSGIGNAVNPIVSLLSEKVYGIPCIFVIGWRGEPGLHDEPQHLFQGEITTRLLEDIGLEVTIIEADTTEAELTERMKCFSSLLNKGKSVAFVVCKGAFTYQGKISYKNGNQMVREEIIQHIVKVSGKDPVVSTTGKASRELFEARTANGQGHESDFLTVGSMGHSSSIALGIAVNKPNTKVWCIDGDGSVLMHMGSMAVIGANAPRNMIHVIINNSAHETVGGMPTVAGSIDLVAIAKACGYSNAVSVDNFVDLDRELKAAKTWDGLSMIEAKCSIGARDDLGRPTISTLENKQKFMEYLNTL